MTDNTTLTPQGVTILLVDDDPDCRMLVRDAIAAGKLDNPVVEVDSGEEALELLARASEDERPALIYLDVEMPGIGGIETLKAIRANPNYSDIAVVMMTGVTEDQQKREALAAGANSYTNKPTSAAAFIQTVLASTNYWLRIHQFPQPRLRASAA